MKKYFSLILCGLCLLSGCGGGSSAPPLTVTPLVITTASLPNGTEELAYHQTIQASGGVAPFTWTVSAGTLPHNLALSSSVTNTVTISGTPDTAAQGVAFTIKVTDSANQSAAQSYTVSILLEPDTLTLAPSSLSFAPQLVGARSGAQAETVTNTGTSEVVISNIALTGTNAADFSQSNTCGSSLAAGSELHHQCDFDAQPVGPAKCFYNDHRHYHGQSTLGIPEWRGAYFRPQCCLVSNKLDFRQPVCRHNQPDTVHHAEQLRHD